MAASARVPGEDVTDATLRGDRGAAHARLMVEVRREGERSRPRSRRSTVDGHRRPLGRASGRGRHQSPPDLRGTAERLAAGRRPPPAARRPGRDRAAIRSSAWTSTARHRRRPAPSSSRIFADRFSADETRRATAGSSSPSFLGTSRCASSPGRRTRLADPRAAPSRVRGEDRRDEGSQEPLPWRHVGTEAGGGWALVIAMHGGGARRELNDQQWQSMFSAITRSIPRRAATSTWRCGRPTTHGTGSMTTRSARWSSG